ncbi:MAG: glycyl-radical enzyme activating protein, partial [Caldicoprobacterales bacterium]
MITNIQRFSLNDGPGIRTTVFFKGCNLSCKWCHNPETLSLTPQLLVYPDKCMGCGACMKVCPKGALQVVEGKITLDRELCDNCGECTKVCFSGALEMAGMETSVADMMCEIEQDMAYYNRSGGGVTLSGGEVLLQPDLARELLKACKEKGIETAIETNLCYDFS